MVADFHASLPQAVIYVYDNNSRDRTAFAARAAGAVVRTEPLQGKGHVVRRMFADVEADVFVLVDGDDTYDAAAAPAMLKLLLDQRLDMVNARPRDRRRTAPTGAAIAWATCVLSAMVRGVFGGRISDVLSGYRAFSRRFVKSFPALAGGFETETEFTVHALELEMPVGEIAVGYRERPAGSRSKLRTWSDGLRILRTILMLVKEGRPLQFFAASGTALLLAALVHRRAGGDGVPAHRPGAEAAQRGAGDRAGAAVVAHPGLRPGAGLGRARPQGDEAAGLSGDPAAGTPGDGLSLIAGADGPPQGAMMRMS